MCEFWPLCRKRHVQRSWIEKRWQHRTLSTLPVKLYQPPSSSGERPVSSKKQPQNAGFQMCSYGIIYHLGISATDLSAAALSCPGAHSSSALGRAASTAAEVHEAAALHSHGLGLCWSCPGILGSKLGSPAGCGLCSDGSCDQIKPLTHRSA